VIDWVYIRFFGNGGYWFRPYGESLGRAPSNQGLLPLSFGASLRPLEGALRSKAEGELTLGLMSGEKQKQTRFPVGARLAREKRPDNAFIQTVRVIVDVHRQQAGSYNFESCEPNHRVGAGLLRAAFRR
jgi:hypothetical protein